MRRRGSNNESFDNTTVLGVVLEMIGKIKGMNYRKGLEYYSITDNALLDKGTTVVEIFNCTTLWLASHSLKSRETKRTL